MARKKSETLDDVSVLGEPRPVVNDVAESDDLPKAFRSSAFVHKPNTRGRVSPYQPLFVPPGVKVALRLAPQPGNTDAVADYKAALMEGWRPVTPEQVTDDVDKAKADGLIAMLVYEEIDGQVRVGPYVVMWKPHREWYREYLEDIKRAMAQQTPGVRVEEKTEEERYVIEPNE